MASATVEGYVKAVYRLSRAHRNRPVTTGQLAKAMSVSPGTVTSMLKTLHESGLASYAPYEGVQLTETGQRLALRVFRRHRLIECFLSQTLSLEWDNVHDDAEHIEHHLSDFLIERIDEYLGHPKYDPHGDPIPAADGTVPPDYTQSLADCPSGTRFRLARVADQSSEFLRYLTQSDLTIDTEASVGENNLEAGIVVLDLNNRQLTLSREAASRLMVIPEGADTQGNTCPSSFSPTAEPILSSTTLSDSPKTPH